MIYIVIANIIAFIASLLMVYSGIIKNKKKILIVQSIQIFLFVISNAILAGIVGAIVNGISFIRNILCYKNKLNIPIKISITIIVIIISIKFNNLYIIGLLPLVSTIIYLWLMNTNNIINFKLLIIFTMILWCIYDFYIKSYSSALFDLLTAIVNLLSILSIKKSKNI